MYYCANETNVIKNGEIASDILLVKGNLCSIDLSKHVFNEHKPTHVIHFAAQSHVQNSFSDALQYTQDNIVGTHTLLEVRDYMVIFRNLYMFQQMKYMENLLYRYE